MPRAHAILGPGPCPCPAGDDGVRPFCNRCKFG
jgi:hypothetical protein